MDLKKATAEDIAAIIITLVTNGDFKKVGKYIVAATLLVERNYLICIYN